MTKTLGIVFIGIALVMLIIGAVFLLSGVISEQLQPPGALLGGGLLLIVIVIPLFVVGMLTITKTRNDKQEDKHSTDLRKILDIVSTRGTVDISDIVIELGTTVPATQNMIHNLVGMGLFTGYINWDEGKLYSVESDLLADLSSCKNCGGQIELAGKGVSKCPYCGTEYYLTQEKPNV